MKPVLTGILSAILAVPSFLPAQTFTTLHSFTGKSDGALPYSTLIQDKAGNLYGTTSAGGASSGCPDLIPPGCGVVFKLDPNGKETVLHTFKGPPDGASPIGALLLDADGNLYGTTIAGGTSIACFGGCGIAYKLDPHGKETILHNFTGGADGAQPTGSLVRDSAGNLYGAASTGGSFAGECSAFSGCGVIFKLRPTGGGYVFYAFRGGTDGITPRGLSRDASGNLYGTTTNGGALSEGTVFKVDAVGKETVLYTFTGHADGGVPFVGVIRDAAGNLYGTTEGGGLLDCFGAGCGVIFKVDPNGKETVLHSFSGLDGALPELAGLAGNRAGVLYGATYEGGTSTECPIGCGVVFQIDSGGKETVLHSFSGGADGLDPAASVVVGSAGQIYGTTLFGGESGLGTVFRMTVRGRDSESGFESKEATLLE